MVALKTHMYFESSKTNVQIFEKTLLTTNKQP